MSSHISRRALWLLLSGLVVFAGCGGNACKKDSVLIQLSLDATTTQADSLVLTATYGGQTIAKTVPHTPGASALAIELDLPKYQSGAGIDLTVVAELAGVAVGEGTAHGALVDSCTALALSVTGTSTTGDMGTSDLQSDLLQSDLLQADLSQTDLSPTPDLGGYGAPVTLSIAATPKIDILFMIDNSPSMSAMQTELQAQFAKFLQPFIDLAGVGFYADLHIGVVTSDYGAGDTAGGGCQASPGGQLGKLQAKGVAADAACAPPTGSPFISYQFKSGGTDVSNLPAGQDLAGTFSCMASVGASGCGFEHQLESALAALKNSTDNAGFLRADALLAVVFLTNEDDGSAPPNVKFYESAADINAVGAYDTYRQTRFGIECLLSGALAPPPEGDSGGPLLGCLGVPPDNVTLPDREYDVGRYQTLFAQPLGAGGLKADPSSVVLVAIDAPETPFQTVTVQTGTGFGLPPNPAYVPCSPLGPTCVVRLQHSCQNSVSPAFFGDPAVRLNSVVRSAAFNQEFSICGDDLGAAPDYAKTLTATGNLLRSRLLANCMPTKLANPTLPDCNVQAHTPDGTGGTTVTTLPRCDQGAAPCWNAVQEASCAGVSPDDVAIVLGAGSSLPVGTTLSASCKTP